MLTKNWFGLPVVLFLVMCAYSALLKRDIGMSVVSVPLVSLTKTSKTSIGAVAFVLSTLYVVVEATIATVFSAIVHWFKPLLAHSANIILRLLEALLRS